MVADLREEGKEADAPRSEQLSRQTKHDEQRAIKLFGGL
jgi:hypothetical protein